MSFTEFLVAFCNSIEFQPVNMLFYVDPDYQNYYYDQTTKLADYVTVALDGTEKTAIEFESVIGGTIYVEHLVSGSLSLTYKLYEDDGVSPVSETASGRGFTAIQIAEGHKYTLTVTKTGGTADSVQLQLRGKLGLKANPKLLFHEITE